MPLHPSASFEAHRNLADECRAALRKERVEALAEKLFIARTAAKIYGMTEKEAEQCFISAEAFVAYTEGRK